MMQLERALAGLAKTHTRSWDWLLISLSPGMCQYVQGLHSHGSHRTRALVGLPPGFLRRARRLEERTLLFTQRLPLQGFDRKGEPTQNRNQGAVAEEQRSSIGLQG